MEDHNEIEPISYTWYHPLCEINENAILKNSKDKILPRKTIKLLTLNIFLRPPPVKNNEDDWKDERLEEFCKIIHDFDIICLQEMFGSFNSRKQKLFRAATKSGFFFFIDTISPSFVSKYMVDGGLVILSRFPIVAYSFTPYRYGVLSDSLAQKGLLYAKIKIKDSFLHLFSTHLQASYFDSGETLFKVSLDTRAYQIQQINHIVSEVLGQQYNKMSDKVILVGDYNVDAHSYKHKKPPCLETLDPVINEYSEMMFNLNHNNLIVYDSFDKYAGYRPITYGDVDLESGRKETVLTHVEDLESCQCLDYIFDAYFKEEPNNDKKIKLIEKSLKVEKLLVDPVYDENNNLIKKFTQLSDHYGLSCELIYQDVTTIMVEEGEQQFDENEEDKLLFK